MLRVAINGFGRTGRAILRSGLKNKEIDFVAINGRDPETVAYLLKYDSVFGRFQEDVKVDGDSIIVGDRRIKIVNDRDPKNLPWKDLDIDVVVESTGKFKTKEDASKHIEAGAKRVLIAAPGKDPDVTIVPYVNDEIYNPDKHKIISLASCTTNCLAPVAKVLHENYGIREGFMTTVHAYTSDQRILDGSHKKFRRGRSAALSIVPTTTGAAKSVGKVLPQLEGRLNGIALRVPVANGSVVDLVVKLEKSANAEDVNNLFKREAEGKYKGVIEYTEDEIVSADIIGNSHSAIFDGLSTMSLGDNLIKILVWYDNEWGYACRINDMLDIIRR
ncbi:MAG: type I glyceraldehyde-3-phosphate dehydrogenase [Candidatus Aenigmatarchaeota archaeon]